jgi:hypoxanthine phosphoribosyltransferase
VSQGLETDGARVDREPPSFAHASEAELARILDFYEVRWEYEPHVFPILWSLDGDVLESFAPDFYLPDLDLYVELTTLRQKLVRKKNRKLRRLRELYPDVRIKLFYARDFRALMLKYGKLAIVDELSGAIGQVVPARPQDELGAAVDTPPRPATPPLTGSPLPPVSTGRAARLAAATSSVGAPSARASTLGAAHPARPAPTAGPAPAASNASRPPRSRRTREAPAR